MAQDRNMSEHQIEQEIWTIVGGHLSPDAIGPDNYRALVARVRANADRYLDVFESLFLESDPSLWLQSELLVPNLLKMVADVVPERATRLAQELLARIDSSAGATPEAARGDATGPMEASSQDLGNVDARIAQRRADLRQVLGEL